MPDSRAHAEEALQYAFVKIWHNAGEYQTAKGAVFIWLTRIVRYRCLDMLRQKNDGDLFLFPAVFYRFKSDSTGK